MKFILLLVYISISIQLLAQQVDSLKSYPLQQVSVTSYKEKTIKETSLNISAIGIDSMVRYGNFNLSDLLAKSPGVSMLSTGIGIAKPVIRGLYGNRVLVLLSGLKFDNQQWQEEHGLGLSEMGLSKVELIKGPMSVLYGTEAIGGIINLVEEQKAIPHTSQSDFGFKLNSNTLGGLVQAGYKINKGKNWFRIRIGAENNADYSDGNNKRIVNSRFDGYYLKSSYGFQKNKWASNTNFSSSMNRFGFIGDSGNIDGIITTDKRWSRSMALNPFHIVLLNMVSSENKIYFNSKSKLNINLGIQSNSRRENEGGGGISLNMHLLTFQYLVKYERDISEKNTLIFSALGSIENNTNYGARKIIPDANMEESNFSVYLESRLNSKLVFENGAGLGQKYIHTFLTPTVNTADKEVHPFDKFSPYYNIFSGFSLNPNKAINLKCNIATGVRIPNLAELSSNGLHEGIFTYEIGNPLLKNEQNLTFNLFSTFTKSNIDISISPFYNYFYNYVYLAPTSESWLGFPVYRYRQQNAVQYGSEMSVQTKIYKSMFFAISYSGMISKTTDGNYTPYIPAQKISPAITYTKITKASVLNFYANINYCMAQNNTARYEIATPQYYLLNCGAASNIYTLQRSYAISISINNLLNEAYYDHLSRFKNFGLLNAGRNIAVSFRIYLNSGKRNSE